MRKLSRSKPTAFFAGACALSLGICALSLSVLHSLLPGEYRDGQANVVVRKTETSAHRTFWINRRVRDDDSPYVHLRETGSFSQAERAIAERIERIPGVSVVEAYQYGIGVSSSRPWAFVQKPVIRALIAATQDGFTAEWGDNMDYPNILTLKSPGRMSNQIVEENGVPRYNDVYYRRTIPEWKRDEIGPLGTAVAMSLFKIEGVERVLISSNEVRVYVSPAFPRDQIENACKTAIRGAMDRTPPESAAMRERRVARIERSRTPRTAAYPTFYNIMPSY